MRRYAVPSEQPSNVPKTAPRNLKPVIWLRMPGGRGALKSKAPAGHGKPGKARLHAARTLILLSLCFFTSPANVIASKAKSEFLEALLLPAFVVLKLLVTSK